MEARVSGGKARNMSEFDSFLRSHCKFALSCKYPQLRDMLTAALSEAAQDPNVPIAGLISFRNASEKAFALTWRDTLLSLSHTTKPLEQDSVLFNLIKIAQTELGERAKCSTTAAILYTSRHRWLEAVGTLKPGAVATKYCLQVGKLTELWCESVAGLDRLELAEYLVQVVMYLSDLGFKEEDLRADLVSARVSRPMNQLCRDIECYRYVCRALLPGILPFTYSAFQRPALSSPGILFTVLKNLMKPPEEGEVEESGIRDRYTFLTTSVDFYFRSPPHSLYAPATEASMKERSQHLFALYSEHLPMLSNSQWDVLFIREKVLHSKYTLEVLHLLTLGGQTVGAVFLDFLISILANLIGLWHKKVEDPANTRLLLQVLDAVRYMQLGWTPKLVLTMSAHLSSMSSATVCEFLLIVWNYLKEFHAVGKTHRSEPYIYSLKILIHRNIDRLGELYSKLSHTG
jgi:hypothetical protein